jgi:hypothetical protein
MRESDDNTSQKALLVISQTAVLIAGLGSARLFSGSRFRQSRPERARITWFRQASLKGPKEPGKRVLAWFPG